VNSIRGLERSDDVTIRTISHSEYDDKLEQSLDPEKREWVRQLDRFYKALFVIDENVDLVDVYENRSTGDGVLGFYEPETDDIYIVGKGHTEIYVNYILSHELTHALQDQNFDLEKFIDPSVYTFDEILARTSLVEGDAMLTMDLWSRENLNEIDWSVIEYDYMNTMYDAYDPSEVGGYSNPILSDMTWFHYIRGSEMVQEVYGMGGFDRINEMYTSRIPRSSEQVIHLEKYLVDEKPVEIEPDFDTGDMDLIFENRAGEFLLSEICGDYGYSWGGINGGPIRGWGGDRFLHYQDDDDWLSVLLTVWDDESQSEDFNLSWTKILERKGVSIGQGLYMLGNSFALVRCEGNRTDYYISSSLGIIERYL
jgi:hypothetical protein